MGWLGYSTANAASTPSTPPEAPTVGKNAFAGRASPRNGYETIQMPLHYKE